jgi:hypothetical protein
MLKIRRPAAVGIYQAYLTTSVLGLNDTLAYVLSFDSSFTRSQSFKFSQGLFERKERRYGKITPFILKCILQYLWLSPSK